MSSSADGIRKILEKSTHIVVLSGINVMRTTGLNGVRAEHIAYETEKKYGYPNEDIVSSAFVARRVDTFYDYYKNVILNEKIEPSVIHYAVRQMEKKGQIDCIITRTVYDLYQKAGCEHVFSMHGSVEKNKCPSCGKIFDSEYIKQAKGIPCCDVCQIPLLPGFTLFGERVDNGKMSKGSEAVENARVLLILGGSLNSPLCRFVKQYYTGNQMILINDQEKVGDEMADYRLYGDLCELIPYVTGYDAKDNVK